MIELLEHNVETYQNLCKEMEKHNKVALIQATGTGKSYIISKYIEEHCHNALILVPANAIGDQWKKLLPNTEVKTYQAIAKGIEKEYDLIVADEMHHLGSDVWGQKFIEYFMQNPEQKVIGATATEIRYLDNARDMVEEIFNGIAVRGVDIATAIDKGILPTFKYVTAYYGSEEDFNEYREKVNSIKVIQQRKDLSRRLEMCIQNRISIKTAMYENLSMTNHNIIVFLNGLCEIEKAIEMFKDMFPDCECNYVSSKIQDKENKNSISRFQKSEKQISILFAVDMLNEGVHIKGVDTAVMFRNTESPQVYFQQIGRVLDANSGSDKVVFDFACNAASIKANIGTDDGADVFRSINKKINGKKKKIIIKAYTEELEKVLCEIELRIHGILTPSEEEYIKTHTGCTVTELAGLINKPKTTIWQYAKRNGITLLVGNNPFSKDEVEYIIKNHSIMTLQEIAQYLNRDTRSIQRKADKLGIKLQSGIKKLTENEKKYIQENCEKRQLTEIARKLNRHESVIYQYCTRNGLKLKTKKEVFEEKLDFIKGHTNLSAEEIGEKFETSAMSIYNTARKNGIKLRIRR